MNRLLSRMLDHADPSQVAGLARFFKTGPGQYGFGDKFLGIKVPVTREVVRECWKSVGFDELEECICSEYHEVRLAALLALVEVFRHAKKRDLDFVRDDKYCHFDRAQRVEKSIRQQCIDFYLSHTQYINNWDLVDLSCYPLLGEWLLDAPNRGLPGKDRSLLYSLAREGKTIWEQRIGMVSTMTFVRHGQLDDTFAIADILLHHPHDLIHKAVGWLLREAGKKDKAALEAYLKEISPRASLGRDDRERSLGRDDSCVISSEVEKSPRFTVMPRTMLRYAIEKFPEAERQAYLRK